MSDDIYISTYKEAWKNFDWSKFLILNNLELLKEKDKLDIALMIAGAAFFIDDKEKSEILLKRASGLLEESKIKIFALSISQVQLGRAAVLAGQSKKGLHYFQSAIGIGGELIKPLCYDFLFQEAEAQLQQGDAKTAIQTWQDLASLLQEVTPEVVYHRMSHCYSVNQKGFGGTQEENFITGDCHKHDLLEFFHLNLQPVFYFEIGVDEGLSLARAKGKALGVDARPELNLQVDLPDTAQVIGSSSDAFFREQAAKFFTAPPDLAFIDGMHLFEFALRDFINIERYAAPYALVGIDDIFPCHPVQAERRRRSSSWTGDIWKLIPILQKYRPDLTLISLPCSTTGLLLIAGLDQKNTCLVDHYDEIIKEYQADLPVPDDILKRSDSLPSDHPVVSMLISTLKQSKKERYNVKEVRNRLSQLVPFIEQAKLDKDLPLYPKALEKLAFEKSQLAVQTFQTQLYLPQEKDPVYSEEKTQIKTFLSSGWQQAVYLFHHTLKEKPVRFDPSNAPGLFEIKDVFLFDKNNGENYIRLSGKEHLERLSLGGDCFLLNNSEEFLLYAYAGDSRVYLPVVTTPETELQLEVTIRQISDRSEMRGYWKRHLENSS